MRFSETEQNGKLEWLIRKDGCMHCEEPGCLKACPSAGAIIQYANGIVDFQQENCIGCGYCIAGCPFNVPRLNKEDNRVYKCTRGSRQRRPGTGLRENLPDRRHPWQQEEMLEVAQERVNGAESARVTGRRGVQPAGRGRYPRDVRAAPCRPAELYHNLPKQPQIDTGINLWKGRSSRCRRRALSPPLPG
jgi:formate dehydrogenase-N beta subunit